MTSTVPAIAGQTVKLYLRERALPRVLRRGAGDKVVLFLHGAGTPAEVSFDVPYQDSSWMGYLAKAEYDTFSVDMTGYGRSARPPQMNDKCNLPPDQQKMVGVSCPQSYPGAQTNMGSDWNDISAAVEYIKKLRKVDKVNLIGWSQGGPRAGGWTALNPSQVNKLILLAPLPVPGPAFNIQSFEIFTTNWTHQAPLEKQIDPAAAASVWSEMLKSDPVGARWTPAVRRAPVATTFGWTTERVKDYYTDLGVPQKVYVELGCASHNAMWEKDHLLLFAASLEWLEKAR